MSASLELSPSFARLTEYILGKLAVVNSIMVHEFTFAKSRY